MFTGCGTAMVTPFRRDLSLDEETLRRLVRRQIDAGINFLVPCGTTGRKPYADPRGTIARCAKSLSKKRGAAYPVLAGAGGYNTAEVIEMAREFEVARSEWHPLRHAVLQQADAGRAFPALQGDCLGDFAADHSLQCSGPHGRATSSQRLWCGSRRSTTLLESRKPREIFRKWRRCSARCPRISSCSRVTMR